MAKVKMQNQEFEIPDALCALHPTVVAEKGEAEAKRQRDAALKRYLSQVSPAATNATLTWSEEGPEGAKQTVVRVAPQLGTKGGVISRAVVDSLARAPQEVPPVLDLAFQLKLLQLNGAFSTREGVERFLGYQQAIQEALSSSTPFERGIRLIAERLQKAPALPSPWVPVGF